MAEFQVEVVLRGWFTRAHGTQHLLQVKIVSTVFTEVTIATRLDVSRESFLAVRMEMVLVSPFMYRPESLLLPVSLLCHTGSKPLVKNG